MVTNSHIVNGTQYSSFDRTLCLVKENDPSAAAEYFAKALEAGPLTQTRKLAEAEISRLRAQGSLR